MGTIIGTKLILNIPPELAGYEDDIERAFGAAIYKLARNTNKGKWETLDMATALKLLVNEVSELSEAVREGNSIDIVMETADVMNFALIVSSIALAGRKVNEGPNRGS